MACSRTGLRRALDAESSLPETARKTRVRRKKSQRTSNLPSRTTTPQSLTPFPRCEEFLTPQPWPEPQPAVVRLGPVASKPHVDAMAPRVIPDAGFPFLSRVSSDMFGETPSPFRKEEIQ